MLYTPPPSANSPTVAHAAEIEIVSIDEEITQAAKKYGVSHTELYDTLECESAHFTVLDGQSFVKDPAGPNGRENSWGIAQFNLPTDLTTADGRTITMEIAITPEEAIDTAAYNFSIGKAARWSCYRQ